MKRLVVGTIVVALLISTARIVMAQAKTISSEMQVETATVEAIEVSTRSITLKRSDGTVVSTVAGPDIKRLDEIKVGDTVTARYYETIVVRLKQPGEPDVNSSAKVGTAGGQALPGGTTARQRTITATITAIDMESPSITFTGPNGWKYSSRVQDKPALAKVKVGDKVDIVWTEAVLMSVERAK